MYFSVPEVYYIIDNIPEIQSEIIINIYVDFSEAYKKVLTKIMKLKIFLLRNLAVLLMLALTSASLILSTIIFFYCSPTTSDAKVPLMLFGDMLLPLLFFIPALIFRSRFCVLAAIIISFLNIFIRLATIILYQQTFMPLDYTSAKLLLQHTDLQSLQAVFGTASLIWFATAATAGLTGIVCCCVITWKTAGKRFRKISRNWLFFFSVLLLLSLTSNVLFLVIKSSRKNAFTRSLPLISINFTNEIIKNASGRAKTITPLPMPEESRKIMFQRHLLANPEKAVSGECIFEKIIIIAAESLDYDYIRFCNPAMPEGITPNLDCFSETYPSMCNYFTASYPTSWGLTALLRSRFDYEKEQLMENPSLFSVARKQNFLTCHFSSCSGFFSNNRVIFKQLFTPDLCFFHEELTSRNELRPKHDWGLYDQALFHAVFAELKKIKNKRFIALVSTIDTHPPYYSCDLSDEDKKRFSTPFLQALHNTDREIGNFVRRIMNDKELFDDKTLIIITADHTATHGENYLNRPDFKPEKLPLIFISSRPEIFKKLKTDKFASSIDLAPTLLKLIGCQIPESFAGNDLFSEKNLAISWQFGDILLLRSPGKPAKEINVHAPPTNDDEKLFSEFYHSLYGK